MKYTITIIHEDGMKTYDSVNEMSHAVDLFREQVLKYPEKMVTLKYCSNYKDY